MAKYVAVVTISFEAADAIEAATKAEQITAEVRKLQETAGLLEVTPTESC